MGSTSTGTTELLLPIGTCYQIVQSNGKQGSTYSISVDIQGDDDNATDDTNYILHTKQDRNIRNTSSSIVPAGCQYVLIYQPNVNDNNDTDTSNTINTHPSTCTVSNNWYLCRLLDLNHTYSSERRTPYSEYQDNSFKHNFDDTTSETTGIIDSLPKVEGFKCSLNIFVEYDLNLIDLCDLEKNFLQWDSMYPILNLPSHNNTSDIQHDSHMTLHVNTNKIVVDSSMNSDVNMRRTSYFIPINNNSIHSPIPLLSIFMTYASKSIQSSIQNSINTDYGRDKCDLQNQPLLQSCIKKQLIGSHVCFWDDNSSNTNGNNISSQTRTTRIQFIFHEYMWTFHIGAVTATTISKNKNNCSNNKLLHHHSRDRMRIGAILPSTRITFIHPIVQPKSTNTITTSYDNTTISGTQTKYHSPAVRILLETIYCISRIQNKRRVPLSPSVGAAKATTSSLPYGDIPRTFLLSGPPGVGKTHAIRCVVQHVKDMGIHCNLIVLHGSEILSVGQYNDAAKVLESHFVDAMKQMKGTRNSVSIIFLDECDALLASSNTSSMLIESILGRLLDEMYISNRSNDMEEMGLIVVAATNRVDAIPISLRRPGRFDREIPMLPPDVDMRMEILQSLFVSSNVTTIDEDKLTTNELRNIAEACVGFVPADLAAVVRRVELLQIMEVQDKKLDINDDLGAVITHAPYIDLWTKAIADIGASSLRDATIKAPPTTTWDDIVGDPGGAKTALRQAIEWPRIKHESFQLLGLIAPRGILLHGPPGCAKTTLARAAANTSAVSFISLSPADVYSTSYVGDAEAVIRRVFTLARSASPCVLFFDEIDAILGMDENTSSHGMGRGSAVEARVLSTFLNEMDGISGSINDGVLVLGATNRPWTLDTALLRPGRFDKIIYVPPPDYEGRRAILSKHCQRWLKQSGTLTGSIVSPINVDYLASDSVSGNMTGAEIVGACNEAAMVCFREATANLSTNNTKLDQLIMKEEYLITALRNVRPLLSNPTIMDEFQSFQLHRTRNIP
jgi:SpoVK/Ycf46/Vps4 family AAA+-type ATPase